MLFRTVTLWALGLPITALLFLLVLIALPFDKKGSTIHSIGAFWSRVILKLAGIRVVVSGIENIPASGPLIFASNHRGIFDIPVLQGNLPVQYRWVAKESLFKIPVIGWTMSFAGYIGINRESAKKSFRSIAKAADKVRAGTSVLVFPEGTRSRDCSVLPFKRGVFFLATRSGVPVVPVSITGTEEIMIDTSMKIHPAEVRLSFGEPVESEGRTEPELMETVREAIMEGISKESA